MLESKETNKRKGKPGGDFSKAGAADRESNVEHMQAAAVPTSEATGGDAGRGDGEKERKRKGGGRLGREKRLELGPMDSEWLAGENRTERERRKKNEREEKWH